MAKPTARDAEVILRLYDLRREPEMRKARNWVIGEFWPANYEEFVAEISQMGSEHNRWWRQTISFWEMAAGLVVHGAVHRKLFLEPSVSGEMFAVYTKFKHLMPTIRERFAAPEFFANIEKIATGTPEGRKHAAAHEKRFRMFRDRMKTARSKS